MTKAFIVLFFLAGLSSLLIWSNVLNLFAGKWLFYIAMIVLLSLFGAAFLILGNPLAKRTDDDKNSD